MKNKKAAFISFYYEASNGSMKQDYTNQTDSNTEGTYEYKFTGSTFGIRFAYGLDQLLIGYDLRVGNLDYEYKDNNGVLIRDSDFDMNMSYGFLMYRGEKFVPWIGVALNNKLSDDSLQLEFTGSSGIMFGLGYRLGKYLQFDITYRNYRFRKEALAGNDTTFPTDGRSKPEVTEVGFGLSLGFGLNQK